jgi:hypothetical protein
MENGTIKKIDFSNKSVLVYDYGLFATFAQRLARDFGKVYYYHCGWKSVSPTQNPTLIGKGLPNVERINNFFDYIDKVDLICFPDILDGDLQIHLESLGYRIWGSKKGEELEVDRISQKALIKKLGFPLGNWEEIIGVTALRKYLKTHDNIWVKPNMFRGDFETFFSLNYPFIEQKIDSLEHKFGANKEHVTFVCEDSLPDKVEIAYDGYSIDGKYPNKTLCGIEVKASAYIGVFTEYNKLPKPIIDFNAAIAPTLMSYRYRNFWNPEMRIGKDHKGYVIDPCARFGSPPSELYYELFSNFSDIVWYGSEGVCVDGTPTGKYAVEAMIHSDWLGDDWLNIQIPNKYLNNIVMKNPTIIDGKHYCVPTSTNSVGGLLCIGNSINDCKEHILEMADQIKGHFIHVDTDSLDKADEEVQKLKDFGFDLFK